jgi:hypothetical protein
MPFCDYSVHSIIFRQQLHLQIAGIRRSPTPEAKANLQERCAALYRSVHKWYLLQNVYVPLVVELRDEAMPVSNDDTQEINAEDLPLLFPSSLPSDMRQASLRGCASKVVRLRLALMEDSLSDLRRYRRVMVGLVRKYKLDIDGTGTKAGTRARAILAGVVAKVARSAAHYRISYDALLRIKPRGKWRSRYLVLKDANIRGPHRNK